MASVASQKLRQRMRDAAAQQSFESATLLVSHRGQLLFFEAFGKASLDSVFDLASLTKPLATAAVAMRLVESSQFSLSHRLYRYIPQATHYPIGNATPASLLSHCSGLPAHRPFYRELRNARPAESATSRARAFIRNRCARQELAYTPGSRTEYSDLGFILLQWAIERATRTRLDRLAHSLIFSPLALTRTGFVDSSTNRQGRGSQLTAGWPFVPTERCVDRGRLVGRVHDDNADAMGGIAGHAGLFSTAYDVHLIVRELVKAYHKAPSIFSPRIVKTFFDARPTRASTWALGWDRPSAKHSSAGKRFSERSVGHLGYTGTSIWIDLQQQFTVILLTNRVYYGRDNHALRRLRPSVHDLAWQLLRNKT